jgi:hypothetical protein
VNRAGAVVIVMLYGALLLALTVRSFSTAVPLEAVSETTANVSMADLRDHPGRGHGRRRLQGPHCGVPRASTRAMAIGILTAMAGWISPPVMRPADSSSISIRGLAADLNEHGKPDVIVGYVNACTSATVKAEFSDLDGDGFPDIVAARSDATSVVFFRRTGR